MLNKEMKELGRDMLPEVINTYIDQIAQHLLAKTQHYKTLNDASQPTTLGTTNFWLIRNKELNRITLGFSDSPRFWDIDGIKNDIMLEEHQMYEDRGVPFQ